MLDTRVGNPYDAVADKDGKVLYLEAKGTQGSRDAVFVTAGEVRFAEDHLGECVMGIVSGIQIGQGGKVVPSSGTLRTMTWTPGDGDLQPIQYRWVPKD